jgi:prepilin-type processing-associated H-X9-DG protein
MSGPGRALRRGGRPGVSLLEVLVIVVLAAVLAGLIVPVLAEALGMADTVRCQGRLRQIGLAYHRHMRDTGGVWPPLLSSEAPEAAFRRIRQDTGLAMAPRRPAEGWGQPGPHWSIILYEYLRSIDLYTCPADPKAGTRGAAAVRPGTEHAVALRDAPPESYALNVVLFRTADDLRRQAGCTWGTRGDADYSGISSSTTRAEQRRLFGSLDARILFFCGASGQTVGSQFNVPFRDRAGLAGVERWEWHPSLARAPFADEPGRGSNYLFHGGHVEYRDELPGLWEWGYALDRPAPP